MEFNFDNIAQIAQKDEGLRDYQKENKQKIFEAWKTCNSVMLQMPTGTGKTRLFVSLIRDLFDYCAQTKYAVKVLILVHRTELIDQIDEELSLKYSLGHGIIQSGDRERKVYPIQIASVQTLSRRLKNWVDKAFDFIIVDEAHHITAQSYRNIISSFPKAKLLGVTATPCRLSGEGFSDIFEKLIISRPVKDFIKQGYLSEYDYYSVGRGSYIQKQIDAIKKFSQGDYDEQEMERVCDNDHIRAQVVETYLKYANGKKGIVYTINKEHNKNLCNAFKTAGVCAVAIDSDTSRDDRSQCIDDFKAGKITIICNVNLFTEGFDCPDIEFIQLARPTKSLALYLQQVGRGLRISGNKEKTIFLDNVGSYNRFGFPSSNRHWRYHFEGHELNEKQKDDSEKTRTEISRKRNPDTTEGTEKVHLIQTTDEVKYIKSRADLFLDIFNAYNDILVSLYDERTSTLELVETYLRPLQPSDITEDYLRNEGEWRIDYLLCLKDRLNDSVAWENSCFLQRKQFSYWNGTKEEMVTEKDKLLLHVRQDLAYFITKGSKRKFSTIVKMIKAASFIGEEVCQILQLIGDREVENVPALFNYHEKKRIKSYMLSFLYTLSAHKNMGNELRDIASGYLEYTGLPEDYMQLIFVNR